MCEKRKPEPLTPRLIPSGASLANQGPGACAVHLVNSALQALVPGQVNRAFTTYFLVLFGVPMVVMTVAIYAIGAL